MENNMMVYVCCECGYEVEVDLSYTNSLEDAMIDLTLCEECYFEKYATCDCCDGHCEIDNMTTVERCSDGAGMLVCDDCLNNNNKVFYCEYHETYEYGDEHIAVRNYGTICEYTLECSGDFCWCEECGECVYDECNFDEDAECYFCNSCYEEICGSRVIGRYHNNKDDYRYNKLMTYEELKENSKDNKCFYGMEIEIEAMERRNGLYSDREEVASILNDMNNSFVFENDGSLNYGFEMITYPFTKAYMDKHLSNQLEDMMQIIDENGYGVKESCGLHFHVTKISGIQENNLIYLTEYFKENFTELSKRDKTKLNRWAKFHTRNIETEFLTKSMIDDCVSRERYSAINISNRSTIEFRFFSGTMDYLELMARYEMIYNMNEYALENEITDLKNIPNFLDLITYKTDEYVSEYLLKEFPSMVSVAFKQKAKATN